MGGGPPWTLGTSWSPRSSFGIESGSILPSESGDVLLGVGILLTIWLWVKANGTIFG